MLVIPQIKFKYDKQNIWIHPKEGNQKCQQVTAAIYTHMEKQKTESPSTQNYISITFTVKENIKTSGTTAKIYDTKVQATFPPGQTKTRQNFGRLLKTTGKNKTIMADKKPGHIENLNSLYRWIYLWTTTSTV